MNRRCRENVIYGCIVIACAILFVGVIPAYTPAYPGYGVRASVLPNVAVGIVFVISLLMLARNMLSHSKGRPIATEESHYPEEGQSSDSNQVGQVQLMHLARFMIPCVLLMPAMQWVGFIPAGIAFMLLIQYLCGQRRVVPALIVAGVTVSVIYLAMRYGFNAPLP